MVVVVMVIVVVVVVVAIVVRTNFRRTAQLVSVSYILVQHVHMVSRGKK